MSQPWLRIDVSRQQIEEGAVDRIREECFRWYMAAWTPAGAQLVSRAPDARRRGRVAMELFFSPAMARACRDAIAAYHPAHATGAPSGEVTLLLGSPQEPSRAEPLPSS